MMKRIRKVLRLICMILLIGLACFGIGIGGPVTVPVHREKYPSAQTETKEEKEEDLKP
ncbi:hypothetical protein [Pedobacter lusitanus]|uniref:hypothetical protein n=1 Tax=Pedobacter lusitanus TaxID=1503925 RepID=UPI001364B2FE|nr:hypothetical protein [Pedobacter lusitanus]